MLIQKFETKILEGGTTKLPRSTLFKKDTQVEVIILEKTKREKINSEKKFTAIDFYNKWVGILKNEDDDYLKYIETKNQ